MINKSSNDAERVTSAKKLVFIVTEDWFFVSHFLPMAREAVRLGYVPYVVTRVGKHKQAIEATGAKVVPFDVSRNDISPFSLAWSIKRMYDILKSIQPSIIHCISLKSIMVGGVASTLAGFKTRIYAVTGWGYLGARRTILARVMLKFVRAMLRGPLQSSGTTYLFENLDDPEVIGLRADDPAVAIIGGAGIDPVHFSVESLPEPSPLRIALVSRMLWSKGVDIAVEAVCRARTAGLDVELSLVGPTDPSNPRSIEENTLRNWASNPGITWSGAVADVKSVWRSHHVACLPSRGGEGLPRTLLESASCGRLSLTTNVPGCRSFVRHGHDGYVLPVNDVEALAAAIIELANNPAKVITMGEHAAQRVRNGYTEADVATTIGRIYSNGSKSIATARFNPR